MLQSLRGRSWLFGVGLLVVGCGDDGAGGAGAGSDSGGAGGSSSHVGGSSSTSTSLGGTGGTGQGGTTVSVGGAGGGSVTTQIRVHYDTGFQNRITLRGNSADLSWEQGKDCDWQEGNVWSCVAVGGEGTLAFKPLFNDMDWAKGTDYTVAVGSSIDIYPFFFAGQGTFDTTPGFMSVHVQPRDLVVYLPPSYNENTAKTYPVLIMHDGQNLFDPSQAFGGVAWEIDEAMNSLATSGGILEAIVVGVDNTSARIDEYTPTFDPEYGGGDANLYIQFLTEEVVPFVHETYRTNKGRVGMAGSSLGGLVSLYGCWSHPDVFDRCGVFSPSLWWDGGYMIDTIQNDPATSAEKPLTIYLDSGDSGPSSDGMANTQIMRDLLTSKGFVLGTNLHYVLGVGHSHNEAAWRARAPGALAFLLDDPDRL